MASFQNEREQLAQLEWLFQENKFAEGLARTETALREFPASFHLKSLRYKFLRQLQQDAAALQLLREMHAMSGDNIMVLKELAELHFQLKQFPESLLYYKKLIFLDSFNSQAQERLKLLQGGMLEAGISDRLADTKVEFRVEIPPAPAPPTAVAAPATVAPPPPIAVAAPATVAPPPPIPGPVEETTQIILDAAEDAGDSPAAAAPVDDAPGLHYQTESAAELYFKQGLYREALAIYKNLFEKTGRTDHFLKIKAILQLLRADRQNRVIGKLLRFQELLQHRGSHLV